MWRQVLETTIKDLQSTHAYSLASLVRPVSPHSNEKKVLAQDESGNCSMYQFAIVRSSAHACSLMRRTVCLAEAGLWD